MRAFTWCSAAAVLLAVGGCGRPDAGLARAAEYPWSRTVGSTVEYYRDILEGRIVPSEAAEERRDTLAAR